MDAGSPGGACRGRAVLGQPAAMPLKSGVQPGTHVPSINVPQNSSRGLARARGLGRPVPTGSGQRDCELGHPLGRLLGGRAELILPADSWE